MSGLTMVGLVISAAWIACLGYYVGAYVGLENILYLLPQELGAFLAGATGPLALLWLTLGYMKVARTLDDSASAGAEQRDLVRRLAEQAERQTQAIAVNTLQARRDILLRLADLVWRDLLAVAVAVLRKVGSTEEKRYVFNAYQRGDRDAFFTAMLQIFAPHQRAQRLAILREDPLWQSHFQTFRDRFEGILQQARDSDPDGTLRRHFEEGAMGRVSAMFEEILREETGDEAPAPGRSQGWSRDRSDDDQDEDGFFQDF